MNVNGKEKHFLAFSDDLLAAIEKISPLQIETIPVAWDALWRELSKQSYDGVLSSLPKTAQNLARYDFSHLYYYLGPVLIVPIDSSAQRLEDLVGQEVGVAGDAKTLGKVAQSPGIAIKYYENILLALEDIVSGTLGGVVLGRMTAQSHTRGFYKKRLRIIPTPIDDTGLRLITLKGEQTSLIGHFNRGLGALKESGMYDELLLKWGLDSK